MYFIILLILGVILIMVSKNMSKIGKKNEAKILLYGGFFALALSFIQCLTVIPAGNVGVVDFFGYVSDKTLKSGVNIVNPLAKIVKFSIKTQENKEMLTVPSKEGLSVNLEISALYSLDPEKASYIYRTIGEDFREIILQPQFRSVVRSVTAKYEAKALYTASREKLSGEIKDELEKLVNKKGFLIESVPMRQMILPQRLTDAIEEKLQAEQESQRMAFILQKEEQEAERKRIEAKGIKDFQSIVSEGINEQLLRWKGIEATEKIASSPNTKVVLVGAGKDGLPIILGNN